MVITNMKLNNIKYTHGLTNLVLLQEYIKKSIFNQSDHF